MKNQKCYHQFDARQMGVQMQMCQNVMLKQAPWSRTLETLISTVALEFNKRVTPREKYQRNTCKITPS